MRTGLSARRRKWRLQLTFQHGFPVLEKAIIENYRRCDELILLSGPLRPRGLQFDFDFSRVSDRCVGAIKRTIGARL